MTKPRTQTKIPALTGLRAVAALWVLSLHFGEAVSASWPRAVRNVLSTGFIGVDLFFVLSGFILAWNYLRDDGTMPVSRSEFWRARAARILPVYYVSLAISIPMFLLMQFRDGVTPSTLRSAVVTALTSLTLTQSWVSPFSYLWNNPGWSLSVELFFYLAFPWLAGWIARWTLAQLMRWVAALYVVTIGAAYLFVALHSHPPTWKWEPAIDYCIWISWLGCNPLVHAHEFIMGIAACLWLRGEQRGEHKEWMRGPVAVAVAIAGLGLLAALRGPIPFMPALVGIHSPLFALLIYGLAKQRGAIAWILSTRAFVFLGEISYSLYLTHLTVWTNVEGFNREHSFLRQGSLLNFLFCLALSLVLAAAFYKGIEEPYRRVIRNRFGKAPAARRTMVLT
ncbi:MAG TPA: acyltransferase [Bryobacteraceae bacterium]|nr:acyltransferase [Bryobacteraceae bacterium]